MCKYFMYKCTLSLLVTHTYTHTHTHTIPLPPVSVLVPYNCFLRLISCGTSTV